MPRLLHATLLLCLARGSLSLPEAMLGKWAPSKIPEAILGPNHFVQDFTVAKDNETGDFWMSAIHNQDFRISGNLMQYCFALPNTIMSEQAPFIVNYSDSSKVVFCWRAERMPTHKAGCQGCDCATITLELVAQDTLHWTFHMSPPVVHAHFELTRAGPSPPMSFYMQYLKGRKCEFENRTGYLPNSSSQRTSPGCPALAKSRQSKAPSPPAAAAADNGWPLVRCRRLDGLSWDLDQAHIPDIRLQHSQPLLSCWPCNISYSVSAAIQENQYIAVGFKGMGYAIGDALVRPNYFGMKTDPIDDERTTSAIALGHASSAGGCFREMESKNYVGEPTDVVGTRRLSGTSVERKSGRTILRFSVEQYAGRNYSEIDSFFNDSLQSSMRVMWAIGDVASEGGCSAALQYHSAARGVAPLNWLGVGTMPCKVDPDEMGQPTLDATASPTQLIV